MSVYAALALKTLNPTLHCSSYLPRNPKAQHSRTVSLEKFDPQQQCENQNSPSNPQGTSFQEAQEEGEPLGREESPAQGKDLGFKESRVLSIRF